MQKSIEGRLTDIESGITRLTKMQGCVFGVLLILHKTSVLIERSERAMPSVKESLEPVHRGTDRPLVFMFGGVAALGVAISMASLYLATLNFGFKVLSVVFPILALVLLLYSFFDSRQTSSQLRGAHKIQAQTAEDFKSAEKEKAAIDDDLEQVLAEWKELVPDDLVSEPKSED